MKHISYSNLFRILFIGALYGITPIAEANLITFDNQSTGVIKGSFTEGLFTISALPGGPPANSSDTATIIDVGAPDYNVVVDGNDNDVYGTLLTISLTDGGLFSVNSIDVADLLAHGSSFYVPCSRGYQIGIFYDGNVNNCIGGFAPTSATFEAESLRGILVTTLDINIVSNAAGFVNGTGHNDFAIDNIDVTPANEPESAPEPTTMSLAVVGGILGALFSRRLRRCAGQSGRGTERLPRGCAVR
jgi:hypothetical protein